MIRCRRVWSLVRAAVARRPHRIVHHHQIAVATRLACWGTVLSAAALAGGAVLYELPLTVSPPSVPYPPLAESPELLRSAGFAAPIDVPEPSSLALLGVGVVALAAARRRA